MIDLNNLWNSTLHNLHSSGVDNRAIFTITSWIITLITYYIHGWMFILADWYGGLEQYAIRNGKHRTATLDKQWLAIWDSTIDTFIIKPLVFYFIFPFITEDIISFGTLPSLYECILDWLYLEIIFSTSLFFIHGALHKSSFLYKNFHKKHHMFYDTISFTAIFAHPVEGILSSLHVIIGVFIIKPHIITFCIFFASTLIEIVDAHCGYDVPWKILYLWSDFYPWGSGSRAHDYHHSHNIGIYGGGITGIWDRIFGSDKEFREFERKRLSSSVK